MNTTQQPVAIVTGASSGIGLGVTQALLERGWRVVGTSRTITKSKDLKPSPIEASPTLLSTKSRN
ncbi:MAG: SDR family NAD(P)-dependent oxidoreductase [Verrucomicrobia bacterium]|nr:SDR family NAD(P)-dependent oxidoreductase [Verrucomicrobiota bacterium]